MITFSPRTITKELLLSLPDRSRVVLTGRYGLDKSGEPKTLEAIGAQYGITRERVRQIEAHSLATLRASDAYKNYVSSLNELVNAIHSLGGVVEEEMLLDTIAKSKADRNFLQFLLVVGDPFTHHKEDADFSRRWSVDSDLAKRVHGALDTLYNAIDPEHLVPEDEFYTKFTTCLASSGVKKTSDKGILSRWLNLSKKLGRNPLGEWGHAASPQVRVKSMRDLAYLTLKRHGSPMHFTEVAHAIRKLFKREAHPATCHNELIKDERFVLVGRGLYALKEWGYQPGVVRDVIVGVLKRAGKPLSRNEIIDRVKRERYVKDATIVVNLQDKVFKKTADDLYTLA